MVIIRISNTVAKTTKSTKSQKGIGGAAFTMTNNKFKNELVVYKRKKGTGKLSYRKTIDMGGTGMAIGPPFDPLNSQDPIIVDSTGNCILAVNAGSNTVATFKLNKPNKDKTNVSFVKTYPSKFIPVSIEEGANGLIFVVNAGENGSISTFLLNTNKYTMMVIPRPCAFESLYTIAGDNTTEAATGTPTGLTGNQLFGTPDGSGGIVPGSSPYVYAKRCCDAI